MKNIVIFALTAMLMGGCDHSGHNHSEQKAPSQEFYGETFEIGNTISVNALAANLQGKDTLETVIEGVIDQTCPHAGCWMSMKLDNGMTQRVTTDHKFFVPVEGCTGLKTKVKGRAFIEETSVEDLKHYAMEEGKSPEEIAKITEPLREVAFLATGIMIEGYEEPEGGAKAPGTCNHDHGDGETHDHEHEGHDHEGHDHEGHDHGATETKDGAQH